MISSDIDITLLNKNNILKIIIGEKLDENIFDSNIKTETITKYLKNLENLRNIKLIKNNYMSKVLKRGNEMIIEQENELSYIITNVNYSNIHENYLILNEQIQKDSFIIPSFSKDIKSINYESLDITVGSYFVFRIKKNIQTQFYNLEFIINKPNEVNKINDLMKKILL